MRIPRYALSLISVVVLASLVALPGEARASQVGSAEFAYTTGVEFDEEVNQWAPTEEKSRAGWFRGFNPFGSFAAGGAGEAGLCDFTVTVPLGSIPIQETGTYLLAHGSIGSASASVTCANGATLSLEFSGGTYVRSADIWTMEIDATVTVSELAVSLEEPAIQPGDRSQTAEVVLRCVGVTGIGSCSTVA